MYRIIFVDDEAIVRDGIRSCVPWDEVGFELTAVLEHGRAALDYIEEHPVDVVLSDINMPRMSGLELSRILGESYPDIIVILLTGYDDFEYAQEAIRNQVREFILKPITSSELTSVLKTIRSELDLEREKKQQQEILKAQLDQSFPLLKERFLYRLVSDASAMESLSERKEYYQWTDLNAYYQVLVTALPQAWSEIDRFSMGEFLKGQVEGQDEVFFNRMNHIVLLLQDRDETALKKRVKGLIDSIYGVTSQFERKIPSIGCGEVVDELKLLERSYKGACSAVDYSRSMGLNQVVTVEEIRRREAPSPEKLNQYNEELIDLLKDGRTSESLAVLKSMVSYLETHYESPRELTVIFLLLYSRITSFLNEMELSLPPEKMQTPEPGILESLGTGEVFFTDLLESIGEQIGRRRNDALHSRVDKAKSIIHERFRDKDFSLQDICRELFLSTSQFSVLFKEGTEQTFVEYLTSVRMAEAKRLLLDTDMKSYEIAEEVGFSDPRYFSIIFKKHCGMTAMEYRRTRVG